jgi:tetratricopeptide (TPR) repeat protein
VLKQKPASAVGPFEKATATEPGNARSATALGLALGATQQFDRSIAVLAKATAMPGYEMAEGYMALGQAYVNLKRYQEAVPALEKATSLAPKNGQAWATLGWAYFGLKDGPKFVEAAGKARGLGYKEPTLLNYLQRIEAGEAIKRHPEDAVGPVPRDLWSCVVGTPLTKGQGAPPKPRGSPLTMRFQSDIILIVGGSA